MTSYCHCLCAVNHPAKRGVCQGESTRTLVFSDFKEGSPLEGTETQVTMCDACTIQTLLNKEAAGDDRAA
jgi:hypothetical protein